MSKSLGNEIALEDSARDMFGKTMRLSDDQMLRYYELLTEMSVDDLENLRADLAAGKEHPRQVKSRLGEYLVKQFHGAKAAEQAQAEFERVFVEKGVPDDIPEFQLKSSEEPIWICHLLKETGLTPSTGEARRLIQQRAVEIDGMKITDVQQKVQRNQSSQFVLKVGKRRYMRVRTDESFSE